jgi:hypothetical protein
MKPIGRHAVQCLATAVSPLSTPELIDDLFARIGLRSFIDLRHAGRLVPSFPREVPGLALLKGAVIEHRRGRGARA